MQIDPTQEWLRLTNEYRAKVDEELLDIQRDFSDLTPVAQQVLAAELRLRGLDKKIEEERQAAASSRSPWTKSNNSPFGERAAVPAQGNLSGSIIGGSSAEPVPEEVDSNSESTEAVEYTWKTLLCECEEREQAHQIWEMLRRAGIESWIQSRERGLNFTRVLVAADELDRARAIIANPIPQDIIDESRETVPEFELPRCPACGAEDPVLESTEPVNSWTCENCGEEWTDPADESQPPGPSF